ncbi:hypothetical protein GYMLUDRAFT_65440 [Collybiopsis luxurians FD-317 M1]|uniref:Uncharacterized protein n=1 Tax=Collybiopsis luxurians FD-317 M1 TaxID=944289 RepID=A0A0D0B7K3_9AGAR|nr:hypothetical protein GYMLUDRAFT_65440 [Collybiopsis luxurians FD-317 M1]
MTTGSSSGEGLCRPTAPDLLEADEHGQVGSEVRKIPEHKSQGSSNYNTNNNGNNSLIDLSDEQIAVIKQAEARLTPQQREQILRRVSIQVPARVAQNTERTPSGKGKSIDPGNWGAANLNEDDINLDVQKQIYESLQKPDILNNWQHFLKWQEDENNRIAAIKIAKDLEGQNAHKQPSVKIEETLDEPILSSSR